MTSGSVRRATADDVEHLLRLRVAMYEALEQDTSGEEWRRRYRRVISERLGGDDFAAVLAEQDGEVVAGGVAWLEFHLPSPVSPHGVRGYISSMSTLPHARGRGHGRRVLRALLGWCVERGVPRVDLRATTYGEPLYRSEGFDIATGLPMTWRRVTPPAP